MSLMRFVNPFICKHSLRSPRLAFYYCRCVGFRTTQRTLCSSNFNAFRLQRLSFSKIAPKDFLRQSKFDRTPGISCVVNSKLHTSTCFNDLEVIPNRPTNVPNIPIPPNIEVPIPNGRNQINKDQPSSKTASAKTAKEGPDSGPQKSVIIY